MPEIFTSAHAPTLIKPGHIQITLRVSDADPVLTLTVTTPYIVNCIDCTCPANIASYVGVYSYI